MPKTELAARRLYGLRVEAGLAAACFFRKSLITAIFWRKICSRIPPLDFSPPYGISQTNCEQSAVTTAMLGAKP